LFAGYSHAIIHAILPDVALIRIVPLLGYYSVLLTDDSDHAYDIVDGRWSVLPCDILIGTIMMVMFGMMGGNMPLTGIQCIMR